MPRRGHSPGKETLPRSRQKMSRTRSDHHKELRPNCNSTTAPADATKRNANVAGATETGGTTAIGAAKTRGRGAIEIKNAGRGKTEAAPVGTRNGGATTTTTTGIRTEKKRRRRTNKKATRRGADEETKKRRRKA